MSNSIVLSIGSVGIASWFLFSVYDCLSAPALQGYAIVRTVNVGLACGALVSLLLNSTTETR